MSTATAVPIYIGNSERLVADLEQNRNLTWSQSCIATNFRGDFPIGSGCKLKYSSNSGDLFVSGGFY